MAYRVLVADDEYIIRRGIIRFLRKYEEMEIVAEAEDGEVAREFIENQEIDVAFVDINMPFLNGLGFIRQLKEISPKTVVVIITGYDDFEYAREGIRLGVFEYLLKPVMEQPFDEMIQKVLGKLREDKAAKDYLEWARQTLKQNMDMLTADFLEKWLDGHYSAEEAEEAVKNKTMPKVVLVRLETSPEDIVGMQVSQGILTVRGGMTSHAAVVARGMGTCCVSGCGNDNTVHISYADKVFEINGHRFTEGDWISLDGSTGNIYAGQIPTVAATGNKNFNRLMGWADAARRLNVEANADNPRDAQQAVDLGAEGIGLCRTEHMFFAEDRIKAVREMICARTVEARKVALAKVEPFQQGDFEAMYRIMGTRPMTIRYLDPPLHEFLPTQKADIEELAQEMGMTFDELQDVVVSLHEFNPMMGHRGCRLCVTYPEIAEMQTNAVIKAALKVSAETGTMITPYIMIPLVGERKELKFIKDIVVRTADALIKDAGVDMKYHVGTMIEIPRAALTADEIAKEADFFSFGTNDLTQMTFGFSRDDAAKFLGAYYDTKIYENDPFQHLDVNGVGKLVEMACKLGRQTNPGLELGICGEHGGDPSSIAFCHKVGLDYVSCSPFRVPIARLAAAQAAIREEQ